MEVKTKKLSDGTIQIGYRPTSQGWYGIHNLYRQRGGYVSDNYPGWLKTIGEWKTRTEEIFKPLDKLTDVSGN